MKLLSLFAAVMLPLLGAACTTTGSTISPASIASTKKIVSASSPVVQVAGPYDAAKACIGRISGINQLNIGVGKLTDSTGKVNMAEGGTGSFISQGVTDSFFNSLYGLGVSVTDLSADQQADVVFISSAGIKGSMRTPSFIVRGSVTGLDFSQQSNVAEATVFGVGPKARAYNALGKMDVRLVTLPGGKLPSNATVAISSPVKQFLAVEREIGVATFVGAGANLTYASARIGSSVREPMQLTLAYMVDYAASDLILKLLAKHGTGDQRTAATQCRPLLDDPYQET